MTTAGLEIPDILYNVTKKRRRSEVGRRTRLTGAEGGRLNEKSGNLPRGEVDRGARKFDMQWEGEERTVGLGAEGREAVSRAWREVSGTIIMAEHKPRRGGHVDTHFRP